MNEPLTVRYRGQTIRLALTAGQPITRIDPFTRVESSYRAPASYGYLDNHVGPDGVDYRVMIAGADMDLEGNAVVVRLQSGSCLLAIGYEPYSPELFTDAAIIYPGMMSGAEDCEWTIPDWLLDKWLGSRVPGIMPTQLVVPAETVIPPRVETKPGFDIIATNKGLRMIVHFSGELNAWTYKWQLVAERIAGLSADDEVVLYICTPGGAVGSLTILLTALQATRARIRTVASVECGSAGPVLWSMGHDKYIMPHTTFMVHGPNKGGRPAAMPMEQTASQFQLFNEYIAGVMRETIVNAGLVTMAEYRHIASSSSDFYLSTPEVIARTGAEILHDQLGFSREG